MFNVIWQSWHCYHTKWLRTGGQEFTLTNSSCSSTSKSQCETSLPQNGILQNKFRFNSDWLHIVIFNVYTACSPYAAVDYWSKLKYQLQFCSYEQFSPTPRLLWLPSSVLPTVHWRVWSSSRTLVQYRRWQRPRRLSIWWMHHRPGHHIKYARFIYDKPPWRWRNKPTLQCTTMGVYILRPRSP